ncbi:MAG: HNH endonuclease [Proteobacteria bacterium]|nr:HNH endonuclease [Pseudomonadota bacterium]
MRFWVGVTDKNWYQFLADRKPDEANFWQPSGTRAFRVLDPGGLFLFKLHSPDNFIVGGGYFVRYSALPASLAWEAFAEKNGVPSFEALRSRVRQYRRNDDTLDPLIGCNILAEPFFFPRSSWVPAPPGWAPNIVQGKTFDTDAADGQTLWVAVRETLEKYCPLDVLEPDPRTRYGTEYLTRGRLGQGGFRVLVTEAYERRCAITGEKTLPVLEAAHIRPYADNGPHLVRNGLLLRSDLHKLFDLGYVTVTPDLQVEVSSRLKSDWHNGREYYAYHGHPLRVQPADNSSRPAREYLRWHNEERFRP